MSKQKTAILLFTRSAKEEAACKVFESSLGAKGNIRIAEKLIERAHYTAYKSHSDVLVYDSNVQTGSTFGERLANAFGEVFEKGYDNVIAIGNDCPYLDSQILQMAVNHLQRYNTVLGPAADGGAYLIGLNKSVFNKQAFTTLPWNSGVLYKTLVSSLHNGTNTLFELPELTDIDRESDFRALISGAPESREIQRFIVALWSVMAGFSVGQNACLPHTSSSILSNVIGLRAPPFCRAA